jgi:hypothetical protein
MSYAAFAVGTVRDPEAGETRLTGRTRMGSVVSLYDFSI